MELIIYHDISCYVGIKELMGSHWTGRRRWMQRGDARVIVLKVLDERPMHGYEVIREISEMFGGMYSPSAGMVYPTLQWLEDESLVDCSQEVGGKKVYKITEAGKKFLANGQETLKRLQVFKEKMPKERVDMIKAGRRLVHTAMTSSRELSGKKAKEAAKILNDAQAKLAKLQE